MRFGLVGTGHWATVTHAPGIVAADGAELVGVWGRRPEATRTLAATHGIRAYDDVAQLFADVDAVAFSVPPDVQAPLAVQAARAGKHLLLEKPIALGPADADAMVTAAEASGVATVVFFTSRFQPDVRSWLAQLPALVGSAEGATGHWLGSAFTPGSPYAQSEWRRAHGGLWDLGPHVLSMLVATLGPVDRIHAERGPRDTTALLCRHASGATSVATVSIDTAPAATADDLVVWGTNGRSWMPGWTIPPERALATAVTELEAAAADGIAHPCDVRLGRDVGALLAEAEAQVAGV